MDIDQILNDNFEGKEGSFIYNLHEKNYFDKKMFIEYLECAIEMTNKSATTSERDEVLLKIFKINNYIMRAFIYHLSPLDSSYINNFPDHEVFDYVDGIKIILESYIKRTQIDKELFSVDLE